MRLASGPSSPGLHDHEAKISHEADRLAQRAERAGLPRPFGNALSGVLLVVEGAENAYHTRLVEALRRSLAAVYLEDAYVTWPSPNLFEEILAFEPAGLVAVGPRAVQAIDSLSYPLAKMSFSEALEGSWFAWTKSTRGLLLPALAPALNDDGAKRRFWRAFLTLRSFAPDRE